MELKSIISISGRTCAGKSYSAALIRNRYGTPIGSFGEYIKYYCIQNGIPADRKRLQEVGLDMVEANPEQFLVNVIAHNVGSANTIVLDGVRHISIFEKIKGLAQQHISLFVDADRTTRFDRFTRRAEHLNDAKSFDQFVLLDSHQVELETESLRVMCDLVLDSTEDYSNGLFHFLSSHNLKLQN